MDSSTKVGQEEGARAAGWPLTRRLHLRPASTAPPAIVESTPVAEAEARDRTFRRLLAYADILAALLALIVSVALLGDDRLAATTLAGLPIIVLVSKLQGLYDRDELLMRKSTIDEIPRIFQLSTLYTLVVWLLDDQLIVGTLGSAQVLLLWAALFSFAVLGRVLGRRLAARATPSERCLFVGDARSYDRLRGKIDGRGVDFVGRMSLQRVARSGERSTTIEELEDLIAWTKAHRVVIEPQALPAEEMLDFVRAAKAVGVRVRLLPRILDVVGTSVVFDEIEGMTIMGVRRFGLSRSSARLKRGFDLIGASVCLLAFAPVLLAIAAAIKLDSRGPVLFRQERVGRDGRRFRICKFRTMVADAEDHKDALRTLHAVEPGLFKLADDPRVTRVGRVLRDTALDELPQLLNVVWGHMSLVGPRPLVCDEDEQITGFDRHRLTLTPGMTGHWQILDSGRVPLHEMVKIDYLYVAGWSLWSDVKVLLLTVPYVLSRRGL